MRFDRPEFGITFDYPVGMTERSDVALASQAGSTSAQDVDVAVALSQRDMTLVDRHELGDVVTEADLDQAKVAYDGPCAQLAGRSTSGTELTEAGMPALSYSFALPHIDCQSTAAHRAEMASACRIATNTLNRG